jgi:hypothetical protein
MFLGMSLAFFAYWFMRYNNPEEFKRKEEEAKLKGL